MTRPRCSTTNSRRLSPGGWATYTGATKVPTRKVPDFVIRLASLFDRDLGSVTPSLGHKHDYSSAKAQNLLGWRPRPLKDTVLETARSLIAHGLV